MKKVIFGIIFFLMIPNFSCAYMDLSKEYWAYDEIMGLKNAGVVSGYPDNTFLAESYINEYELCTIILRACNTKMCETFSNWPQDYIGMSKSNNIIINNQVVTKGKMLSLLKDFKKINSFKYEGTEFYNELQNSNLVNERDLINLGEKVTRAEACYYISKLINIKSDLENSRQTEFPKKAVIIKEDSEAEIKTIINSAELIKFDTHEGNYKNTIDIIKFGQHPYLKYRKSFSEDKYILALNFDTVNESKYSILVGHDSIRLEFPESGIFVEDEFDLEELNAQVNNLSYSGRLVKPGETYNLVAFYVLNSFSDEAIINRDINTLYNEYNDEYVNTNFQSSLTINLLGGEQHEKGD